MMDAKGIARLLLSKGAIELGKVPDEIVLVKKTFSTVGVTLAEEIYNRASSKIDFSNCLIIDIKSNNLPVAESLSVISMASYVKLSIGIGSDISESGISNAVLVLDLFNEPLLKELISCLRKKGFKIILVVCVIGNQEEEMLANTPVISLTTFSTFKTKGGKSGKSGSENILLAATV